MESMPRDSSEVMRHESPDVFIRVCTVGEIVRGCDLAALARWV